MSASGMDWRTPYLSPRVPIAARNVVATSQPLAVQAGLDALRRGGNAVDAALAAAITLTVVEPNNNGVGSDAFAIVWDGRALHGLNASGRSPLAWTHERFAGARRMPDLGWDSVTVPGHSLGVAGALRALRPGIDSQGDGVRLHFRGHITSIQFRKVFPDSIISV